MKVGAFRFNLVTLFPEYFEGPLGTSLIGKAVEQGLLDFNLVDPRNYADNPREVDDYSFGGGPGMVLAPGPIFGAVEAVDEMARGPVVCLSAAGRPFDSEVAQTYAGGSAITLVCGRYEGIDQRVIEHLCTEELSVGDFVLSGGEAAALVVIDAVARLVPGVMGNLESAKAESHSPEADHLLEYPQYTRPAMFREWEVPEVLRSGDHGEIARWRRRESLRRTAERRPELLANADISESDVEWLRSQGLWPLESEG
ncbi:MAG: tRNA (guanosine(37)-N1)-methyltransferase TrmD [Acidobacteria bacterium]|nr:MAG: tRNA (guanosine(37)-N1)-methyltransferase TrmD [Acidobacteriota bacterium]